MPVDIQMGQPPEEPEETEHESVEKLMIRLENAYELARENLGTSVVLKMLYYDMKAIDEPYWSGDRVWLVNKSCRKGICLKLER